MNAHEIEIVEQAAKLYEKSLEDDECTRYKNPEGTCVICERVTNARVLLESIGCKVLNFAQ